MQVVTVQCERAKGECKKLTKEFEAARRQVNIVGKKLDNGCTNACEGERMIEDDSLAMPLPLCM